ncbi:hypothetical protein K435DRAFT_877831 [Dendrothele bispora CBS 962.96]|uniref:Uncharacterized protein n=1 Tax=Dendrothele bispora (strain CBS 962.96) TaxID=1314807 RepID=A0A4S8KPH3_DENBC|nr:hypothetical protein K435DRAFT_877831 [Dendrothele bispora CBS 962.96]
MDDWTGKPLPSGSSSRRERSPDIFQNLINQASDPAAANDVDIDVPMSGTTPPRQQPSSFQKIYEELMREAVSASLKDQLEGTEDSDDLEDYLKPDEKGFIDPFGDPRTTNMASARRVARASSLKQAIKEWQNKLDSLSGCTEAEEILSILVDIEDAALNAYDILKALRRSQEVEVVVQKCEEVEVLLGVLQESLRDWRKKYPDASPVKIDNRHAFFNPNEGRHAVTLVAYCVALAIRAFTGASQRAGTFVLKTMKLFGYAVTHLAGGPNMHQDNVLSAIPESIGTLENKLNLGVQSIPYAVCKSCGGTYEPQYEGRTQPKYPSVCSYPSREDPSQLCGESLITSLNNPRKIFHYYPFFDWFGKFISLPEVEEYGEAFCKAIDKQPEAPDIKRSACDGSLVRDLRGPGDVSFILGRGEEGRWLFKLHADFFNTEGNRQRGRSSFTGLITLMCLNLPLKLANDPAYIYVAGLIEGPKEPEAKLAAHNHYLRPLITELEAAWTRGMAPYSTHTNYSKGADFRPYQKVSRAAIVTAVMDLKAARPFLGLKDINSHFFCFSCLCWHKTQYGRTDYENWSPADGDFLKEGAMLWSETPNKHSRKTIEGHYGTRACELDRLPYWDTARQLAIDSMHSGYLNSLQNFFRKALALENPKDPPNKKRSMIAFHYPFTPPPHPYYVADLGTEPEGNAEGLLGEILSMKESDDDCLKLVEWSHLSSRQELLRQQRMSNLAQSIQGDSRALRTLKNIHVELSSSRPTTASAQEQLQKELEKARWHSLAYVCNDLMVFPPSEVNFEEESQLHKTNLRIKQMAEVLMLWRANDIQEDDEYTWPFFNPINGESPSAPWAKRPVELPSVDDSDLPVWHLTDEHAKEVILELTQRMNYLSAENVGTIHRKLREPLEDTEESVLKLRKKLQELSSDALSYVCIDLKRIPNFAPFTPRDLVNRLVAWRMEQDMEELEPTGLDSVMLLDRIHKTILETVTPSWMSNPPPDIGLPSAGTIKAAHWRTLFSVHLPLALLSLWKKNSPIAAKDARMMGSILQTSMAIACASIIMAKNTLTPERREMFLDLLKQHIEGLKEDFPNFLAPSHHSMFHLYDFMGYMGPLRYWWCFPPEHLIFLLQGIPTNHRIGQREHTILQSFYKGASIRRWLLRPDCPPLLKIVRDILDNAYGFKIHDSSDPVDPSVDPLNAEEVDSDHMYTSNAGSMRQKLRTGPPSYLVRLVGDRIECFSSVSAPYGYYSIPSVMSIGNSYVCFKPEHEDDDWVAGQIQHIFQKEGDSELYMVIKRSRAVKLRAPDPFSAFWNQEFEAKQVSPSLAEEPEIMAAITKTRGGSESMQGVYSYLNYG